MSSIPSFTDEDLRDLLDHHVNNAKRGNVHFFGNREEADTKYVERQTKIANMIQELLDYRRIYGTISSTA